MERGVGRKGVDEQTSIASLLVALVTIPYANVSISRMALTGLRRPREARQVDEVMAKTKASVGEKCRYGADE